MGKLDDFDLDITIKKSIKKGVGPATTNGLCTIWCPTRFNKECITKKC